MSKVIAASFESINATSNATLRTGNASAGYVSVLSGGGIVLSSNSTSNSLVITDTLISTNSNIAIGTDSTDGYKFAVKGVSGGTAKLYMTTDTTTSYIVSNGSLIYGTLGVGNYLGFSTNGGERLRISFNGNTGIGNTDPQQRLVVEGDFYANGAVLQTVYNKIDTKAVVAFAAAGSNGSIITDLNTTITPKRTTSKVLINYCLTYEVTYNTVFRLFRTIDGVETQIGRNTLDSNYWSGTWVPGYDYDDNSTPRTQTMMFLDSPGVASPITYKLMIQSSGVGATNFYLNRSIASAGASQYEVGISTVYLQEIGVV
jgi:hypothetical protein